jgi:L-seryl-tRNA(Ser) seleniumtransferase
MQKKKKRPTAARPDVPLGTLPAVSRLLDHPALVALIARYGAGLVTDLVRARLDRLRTETLAGRLEPDALQAAVAGDALALELDEQARALLAPRPRHVINATGVVVHTNLGRAVLSERAAAQLAVSAQGYVDLEYDVAGGRRGDRLAGLVPVMQRLFPGHGFTVVNNNAAAVLLCLHALCREREALVSRGELVEIGGSFRIPDVMIAAGARLREVGTTNRTRLADYERVLGADSGLILKVHTSNFRVVGFTEETTVRELATVARRAGVPLLVDGGSGDLVDLAPLGILDELPVSRVLAEGADLVTFSGDKLLGGPQSGFVVGDPALIERVRRDPLARACRVDRLRLGALQQTLAAYVTGRAFDEVPTLRLLAAAPEAIERRAVALRSSVAERTGAGDWLEIVDGVSRTGGGSSPVGERPTRLLAVALPEGDAGALERRLREGDPPVVGRVQQGRLLLDLRTVLPSEEAVLAARLAAALVAELARASGPDGSRGAAL